MPPSSVISDHHTAAILPPPPYDLYRLMHFRRYHAGGLHVGPARTLLQIALKGIGVVEMNTALDYFTGLRENTAACTAAIYLCSKTDAKNGSIPVICGGMKRY